MKKWISKLENYSTFPVLVLVLSILISLNIQAQCDRYYVEDTILNKKIKDVDVFLDSLYARRHCIKNAEDQYNFYIHASYALNNWPNAKTLADHEFVFASLIDTVAHFYPDRNDTIRIIIAAHCNLFLQNKYQQYGYYERSSSLLDTIWDQLINAPIKQEYNKSLLLSAGIFKARYLKKTNQYNRAIEKYIEVLDYVKAQHNSLASSGRLAKYNAYIADCYMKLGSYEEARIFYKKGLESLDDLDGLEEHQAYRLIHQQLADCEIKMGNPDTAEYFLRKSTNAKYLDREDQLTYLRLKGDIHQFKNQIDSADNTFQKLINLTWNYTDGYNNEKVKGLKKWFFIQNKKSKWPEKQAFVKENVLPIITDSLERSNANFALSEFVDLLHISGEYYLRKFILEGTISDLMEARQLLNKSISLQNDLQKDFQYEGDIIENVSNRYDIYESAIYADFLRDSIEGSHSRDEIFNLFEQSKSRILLSGAAKNNRLMNAALPDSIIQKLSVLKSHIRVYEAKFQKTLQNPAEENENVHLRYKDLKDQFNALKDNIDREYNVEIDSIVSDKIISLSKFQQTLADDVYCIILLGYR